MVVSAGSLAVSNWHVSNPECNAQLSIVSARAVKHDRTAATFAPSCAVQQVQEDARSRRQTSRDALQRFHKATLRRLHQQKARCDVARSQSESILKANLDQYKTMTEAQIARLLSQHESQLRAANKAPLYRERDRVLAQSHAIRQHLLTFKSRPDTAAGRRPDADDGVKPVAPERAAVRLPNTEPFWARVPLHLQGDGDGRRILVSKLQQAQLAAAVRKVDAAAARS